MQQQLCSQTLEHYEGSSTGTVHATQALQPGSIGVEQLQSNCRRHDMALVLSRVRFFGGGGKEH